MIWKQIKNYKRRIKLQTKRIQRHKNTALNESNDMVDQTETSVKEKKKTVGTRETNDYIPTKRNHWENSTMIIPFEGEK